jgi:D-threo-aldose 1-dehydrogenase
MTYHGGTVTHARSVARKRLGKTGVEVTTVGIGTAWIGTRTSPADTMDVEVDEDQAVATVHAALEEGIGLIDTAPLYLGQRSEQLVGRALRERPDLAAGVVVETKCCRHVQGRDYSYDGAMRSVQGSLERLGVERIELIYVHDPPRDLVSRVTGPGGALQALRKLQGEGVVGHIGVASNYPDDNAPYVETGEFEMAVVPDAYSLLNQIALERIFPAAERFDMGVVVATPLERGILATGVKASLAEYLGRRFRPEVLRQVEKLESVCEQHGVSLAAVALQFVTRHPVVSTTIPGPRSPEEARQNALAAREHIPEALWQELEPLVTTWEIVAR